MILNTPRLSLRELTEEDYFDLCGILQDKEVMYAYEHAFTDKEVQDWLNNQLRRYRADGFGLYAVILKETGALIGQAGITLQELNGKQVPEIGYLFKKSYWHNGFATEAANALKEYAFYELGIKKIYSIIRDNNLPSQNVAKRNGMHEQCTVVKHYYGMDMPHTAFCADKDES